jgi:cell division septation protein DedD
MRRVFVVAFPVLFLMASGALSATPAAGQVDRDALRQGLIYDGLERVAQSDVCHGNFRVPVQYRGLPVCTHGPDPAPPGVDVRADRQPPASGVAGALSAPSGSGTAQAAQVPCIGNGSDGFRVQLIYARASDQPDGYTSWLPSMQQWAARVDDVFNASAAETGGVRHVRFVHDANCVPVIDHVVLSPSGDDNFNNMLNELRSLGYTRTDRKYLVWMDANVYCGIAQVYYDDSPTQGNASNGNPAVPGEIARVDKGCWGLTNLTEAHELVHTLGGVQTSAPHATPYNHCTDDYDRMCYSDGSGFAVVVCGDPSHENRLDCNHDDYYSTAPPAGSYLATHWNVANNAFLVSSGGTAPPPTTTTTTSPPTTSPPTTSPPTTSPPTTSPPTTSPPTTSPPTTAPPTTSPPTTAPPTASAPSAPQTFFSTQPSGTGHGVLLFWTPPTAPGNPPFTTYRIYRGLGPTALSPLVDVPAGTTSYNDTNTTSGALYWYAVTAVSPAAQSPFSNLTRMVAR